MNDGTIVIFSGGLDSTTRNIISSNGSNGIEINSSLSTGNKILGNYIGTDKTGTVALGNRTEGIGLYSTATGNIFGGTAAGILAVVRRVAILGVIHRHPAPSDGSP